MNRYTIQAYSNADGWQDSKYGADTFAEARREEIKLLSKDSAWMPGKRETRIKLNEHFTSTAEALNKWTSEPDAEGADLSAWYVMYRKNAWGL